ncbi:MAG: phosphoribosylformylglycinamidine cyclo-ligase [Syntrophales bacterium]|jgi:phosphoribosylformylglycinamidine cyclo-ligase|nr:phosphoribosylformylglycinamidine cyclo-ligase [Syntrophales bacterium]MDY0044165.1 phosphoribosylformylglycinamidine cyclo-ligase [Syntrophales bacterium]
MGENGFSYKDAGVDIDRANSFIEKIRPLVKKAHRKGVLSNIGSFGGLFHLDIETYKNPVLVSTTDGVGTKLMIAHEMDKHDTVGIDLVAMNVNDLTVQGAEPLFFLDYIACGKIDTEKSVNIIEGIVKGCTESGCALIGGETAEMPGFYKDDDYDLAGFCVGVVDYEKVIDGSDIRAGDTIIGLASSGIHSNGYSLVRKALLKTAGFRLDSRLDELDEPLGLELLRPTRIYTKAILNLIKNVSVNGMIHITGGGFIDNIPRILPEPCQAVIQKNSWPIPPIFKIIQRAGQIEESEMYRVFNMGIGMMVIIHEEDVSDAIERLTFLGEKAYIIGSVSQRSQAGKPVIFE